MSEITGLLGQVVAVENLDDAIANYEHLGFTLGTRFLRTDLGIDTAMFGFENGSHLELVSPTDPEAEVARSISAFLERRGEGLYLTSLAVDDVYQFHDQLVERGLPVLGPPQPVPPERSMACDVLWIKPRATASAFVQFLSYRGPRHREEVVTPGVRRLFTQVFAVRDLGAAIESFEALGLTGSGPATPPSSGGWTRRSSACPTGPTLRSSLPSRPAAPRPVRSTRSWKPAARAST
jgi:hypothetical protein